MITDLEARAVAPERYAIGGVAPRSAWKPISYDELSEALSAAAREGLRSVPWGGGVSAPRDTAPSRYDVAIDLSALDRVIEYQPEDLSLTAQCGATIATLGARLAERGQELPLEAAEAHRATLGGVLAANASGPRRLRLGAPRDRVMGARFALADGTVVRSGGKVVKSVAGYALHRLLCGSRGGLAILVEASLKLLPAPAARMALIYEMDAGALTDPTRWSEIQRLQPAALSVLGPAAASAAGLASADRGFAVLVALEDDAPRVEEQVAAITRRFGAPQRRLVGGDALAGLQKLADLEEQPGARMSFTTAHNSPAALAPLVGSSAAERLVFHALAGRLHLFDEAAALVPLPARLSEAGIVLTSVRGTDSPPADPLAVATRSLRGRIRAALDPAGLLAWGERWSSGTP